MSFTGNGSSPGDVFTWNGVTRVFDASTSSSASSLKTWSLSAFESQQQTNSNITFGRCFCIRAIAPSNGNINAIQFFCTANPLGGTCGVAIYNAAGIRLAYESNLTAQFDLNTIQLTNDTGTPVNVPLVAGESYYLAFETNVATLTLLARPSPLITTSAFLKPTFFWVNNPRALDPTGFKIDVSGDFPQTTAPNVRNFFLSATLV